MAKAGVRAPLGEKKQGKGRQFKALGFHSTRHAQISNLSNADVSPDVRKKIAGHSTDEVHRRYVHLELSAQRRAIEKIPSVAAEGFSSVAMNKNSFDLATVAGTHPVCPATNAPDYPYASTVRTTAPIRAENFRTCMGDLVV
jgi:hypothetical protein